MEKKYIFGIDAGGTKVAYGLFDLDGKLLDRFQHPTDIDANGPVFCDKVIATVNEILAKHCANLAWCHKESDATDRLRSTDSNCIEGWDGEMGVHSPWSFLGFLAIRPSPCIRGGGAIIPDLLSAGSGKPLDKW